MDSSASIPRTIHYFSLYRSVFHACIIVERLSETSKYLSRINIIYTEQWRFYEINVLNMYEIQNGLVYTLFKWNMQNICNIENIQNKNFQNSLIVKRISILFYKNVSLDRRESIKLVCTQFHGIFISLFSIGTTWLISIRRILFLSFLER